MFALEALQLNGAWYVISTHATATLAQDAMYDRPAWRTGRVRYRIVQI
jgi:hypothetical protein